MWVKHHGLCDNKPAAQLFLRSNFPDVCVFTDVAAFIDGIGDCRKCGFHHQPHKCSDYDLLLYTGPCQSFTRRRNHSGSSSKQGVESAHPSFETAEVSFLEMVKKQHPGGGIFENIQAIMNKSRDAELPDKYKSWSEFIVASLTALGYSVAVLDHFGPEHFIDVPRQRVFILFLRQSHGGSRGLSFIVDLIEDDIVVVTM